MMKIASGDPHLLYHLPQPLICGGSAGQEIDTGITPFLTCSQFTALAEASPSAYVKEGTVVHCKLETGKYPGFSFDRRGTTNNQRASAFGNSTAIVATSDAGDETVRYAVKVDIDTRHAWNYVRNITTNTQANDSFAIASNMGNLTDINKTMLIGCYQNLSGTRGRYFKGTINSVYLFDRLLEEQEINTFLTTGNV